jgi:hypothetical protein
LPSLTLLRSSAPWRPRIVLSSFIFYKRRNNSLFAANDHKRDIPAEMLRVLPE